MKIFLGYNYDLESLKAVADRVDFSSMKSNPRTNYAALEQFVVKYVLCQGLSFEDHATELMLLSIFQIHKFRYLDIF